MAKNTSTVVEVDDAAHDNGLIGEDITESIVQWIRTLKKEGVSPDTAAQVYVGVLQTAIAAQCDSDYIMDAYDEFDDEDEDEEDEE